MRLSLSLCILLLLASGYCQAECECVWQGSFSEVQATADWIVSGTVTTQKGNSIDLTIDRLLRSEKTLDTVRIWLKTADYCRPEVDLFPVGSQWVMAVQEIVENVPGGFNPSTPNISYGRVGDYRLSNCGGFWLSQRGDHVSGNLVNAPRWVREPKMTPVLVDLIADYVNGKVDRNALVQASREDPALRELMLDTRSFLRKSN
jgi:hypothetical protein